MTPKTSERYQDKSPSCNSSLGETQGRDSNLPGCQTGAKPWVYEATQRFEGPVPNPLCLEHKSKTVFKILSLMLFCLLGFRLRMIYPFLPVYPVSQSYILGFFCLFEFFGFHCCFFETGFYAPQAGLNLTK